MPERGKRRTERNKDIRNVAAPTHGQPAAAGRDPKSIRRVLNYGYPIDDGTADALAALVLENGMDSFMVSEDGDEPREHLSRFMSEVAPRVREKVAEARESR